MGRPDRLKFSLIVSSYNLEEFLDPCLQSLGALNYAKENYEIICIDDGSTDNSLEIIVAATRRIENLRVILQENTGLEKACNRAIRAARHQLVLRVDADDILPSNFLQIMSSAISLNPQYDFYYCGQFVEFFNDRQKRIRKIPEFDVDEIFERGDFLATGTVYRKFQLLEVGLYPEEKKNCGLENYDLILKLITSGRVGMMVAAASFYYRRHQNNMSKLKRCTIIEYGEWLLETYSRPYKTNENHPYDLKLIEQ